MNTKLRCVAGTARLRFVVWSIQDEVFCGLIGELLRRLSMIE
jgi:hypothetical protein